MISYLLISVALGVANLNSVAGLRKSIHMLNSSRIRLNYFKIEVKIQINSSWFSLKTNPSATFKWPFATCGVWWMGWPLFAFSANSPVARISSRLVNLYILSYNSTLADWPELDINIDWSNFDYKKVNISTKWQEFWWQKSLH